MTEKVMRCFFDKGMLRNISILNSEFSTLILSDRLEPKSTVCVQVFADILILISKHIFL